MTPRSSSKHRALRQRGRLLCRSSHRPAPLPITGGASRWLAPLLAAAGLSACAITPMPVPRADLPLNHKRAASSPPSVSSLARELTVDGHHGRLDTRQREALLQKVGDQGSQTLVQQHLAAMSSYGELHLYAGNEVRLLVDGPAAFAAMFKAIENARQTILLESYIIEHAEIAQQLAALLKRKREQGVQVAVIYDAVGSIGTDERYFESLRQAGIAVCAFNPINPLKRPGYWDITHRDHRKILVVDRELGFVGGINISAVYSSGSFGRRSRAATRAAQAPDGGWRDTQIELRGSAAAALDDLVRETWQHQACKNWGEAMAPLPPPATGPARAAGGQVLRVIPATPEDSFNEIYAMLLTAIDSSQRSAYFTMAYFAPGQDLVDALCDAARRGVDVQLILPSLSDFSPVLYAGRSYYSRLLESGVKIYELQDAVLHAKTAVIDGVVSTVGSSNMDWRSFTGNNEVNAVVIGEDFGDAMTRMFRQDVAASQAITREDWAARSLWQRTREAFARLLERWW